MRLFSTEMLKLSKSMFLFTLQTIQVIISQRELVFQLLSSRLNTRPYNRLDKEVADFKKHKGGPAVPHNTKYFHYKDEKDINNDKECKIHT